MNADNIPAWAQKRLSELILAAGLLTRLPMPQAPDSGARPADGLWAFPLIGAVIGLACALIYWLADLLALPAALCAAAALTTSAFLTGLLHEDGLADFADAAGGADKAEKLTIMRDSRIGTYGVAALVASFFTRWAALAALSANAALLSLIAVHLAARGLLAIHYLSLKPARTDGLAASAGHPGDGIIIACLLVTLAGLGLVIPARAVLFAAAAGLTACLVISWTAKRAIGGYSGDTLGACEQAAEIAILAALAALWAPA